jgi:nucleotide-binding universal stress UspA family protein
MGKVESRWQVSFKNILFLTDFSEPSEAALPFATSIAREYGAKVFVLHVFTPDPPVCYVPSKVAIAVIETGEQHAKARVESQLVDLEHETIADWNTDVWEAVQRAIETNHIDLIVIGTHGRTGVEKFFMGSVVEEIFRCSPVPVLTIGPHVRTSVHGGAQFHRVLFPTDLTDASLSATPYAISLAQENNSRLFLLHVMRSPQELNDETRNDYEWKEYINSMRPFLKDAELRFPAQSLVEYGEPADRILAVAEERSSDLIVLGVRDASAHIGATTHPERATAHKIVAQALCPVLTVSERVATSDFVRSP